MKKHNFKVVIDYGAKLYMWKGEAVHLAQARAIARSQLCRLLDLDREQVFIPVQSAEETLHLNPESGSHVDIRVELHKKLGRPIPKPKDMAEIYNQMVITWKE